MANITKFTDRQIKNLKPKETRYEIWEGNGFGLRISPTGTKSWIFVYHYQNRPRRITFGKYPGMSVGDAHAAYGKAVSDLQKGIDPGDVLVTQGREHRSSLTVKELITEYLEKWAKQRKRSWQEDERMLVKDVLPTLGNYKARDIKKRDIICLLDSVLSRGSPIATNRLFAVVRRMFNFAVERDIIEVTPCYGIKAPTKENQRDRILSAEEIKNFVTKLNNANMSELVKLALHLQLITAQRKGEVITAEWEEFDLKNKRWVIPAHKSKNANSHLVPLSDLAIETLSAIKKLSGDSNWLFPSPMGSTHILPTAVDHALRKNIDKFEVSKAFTPHDLRRTAASHMTALGVSRLVVSKILNHVERSVTAIYDRHTYEQEKRQALYIWGDRIGKLLNE